MGAAALKRGSAVKVYDSDGDYIGKIKIKTYREYSNLSPEGNKLGGLEIELIFKSESNKYNDYNWVQTIFTNDSPDGWNYDVYTDRDQNAGTSPFYLNKEELSTFKRGNELTFFDKPSRILNAEKNIAWRAELTLVGFNSSGAHALHTIYKLLAL